MLAALGASVLVSGERGVRQIAARAACGGVCAVTLTPLVSKWVGAETAPQEWGVAALLMATGYSLMRFLANLRPEDIQGWLRRK